MALIYCSVCGKQISAEAASCPHCGHPKAAAPKKAGGDVFWGVIGGLAVLAALLMIAGIWLVATKPSQDELRAAALAKRDSYVKTDFKDGRKVSTVVDNRGNSLIWSFPGGPEVWLYRDCFFWSELVIKFKDGSKEILVARGMAGKIRVTDE